MMNFEQRALSLEGRLSVSSYDDTEGARRIVDEWGNENEKSTRKTLEKYAAMGAAMVIIGAFSTYEIVLEILSQPGNRVALLGLETGRVLGMKLVSAEDHGVDPRSYL